MSFCDDLITKVRDRLASDTRLAPSTGGCVISLPLLTADHRRVSAHVVEHEGGYRVHDDGQTLAEFYVQGIHSETRVRRMASRLGVAVNDGVICFDVEEEGLVDAIMRMVQAQTLLTSDLLLHEMSTAEHPRTRTRVDVALRDWKPKGIREIKRDVVVRGQSESFPHKLDYVAYRGDHDARTVAVKMIPSTMSAKVQLERYGFLALDLENTDPGKWPRLAVITRGERWTPQQIETVGNLSTDLLVLSRREEIKAGELVRQKLERLAAA